MRADDAAKSRHGTKDEAVAMIKKAVDFLRISFLSERLAAPLILPANFFCSDAFAWPVGRRVPFTFMHLIACRYRGRFGCVACHSP